MKTKTTLAALLLAAFVVTPSYGDNVEKPEASPLKESSQVSWKDKSLEEKLQGSWSRTDHWVSFVIKGNRVDQFAERKPLEPRASGRLNFKADRDYAICNLGNWQVWIWSAGKNVIAMETFTPSGEVQGEGRIFYRINSDSP